MHTFYTWIRRVLNKQLSVAQLDFRRGLSSASRYLFLIFALHTLMMMHFETLNAGDAIWLTLTTITTVGYGDISATTFIGRLATVVLLYIGGIFVLAKVAGDYFEYHAIMYQQKLKGHWRWNMHHHIVIISDHEQVLPLQYYEKLINEFRNTPKYKKIAIQLLSPHFTAGLPESLRHLALTHFHGSGSEPKDLEAVNIQEAKIIVVLARDFGNVLSDSITFDILHRIRDVNTTARVLAECVDENNRRRLYQAGADILIRPTRLYPELIVGAFNAPGAEQVIENMVTNRFDEYHRFDITIQHIRWADIVSHLMEADIGTAIAYVTQDNEVCCNPAGTHIINGKALIVIIKENMNTNINEKEIEKLLNITPQSPRKKRRFIDKLTKKSS